MTLKTDYKDDVLDLTQNANRKFQEIENQDGSISFNDVTVYEQDGDEFGAADVNAITRALTDTTHGVSFQFGIDTNGDYGYIKDGESEVTPFRNRHTETITPNSRATVDMGEFHKKRYVDLSAVPNVNSQVAYFTQNTGGNYDLGAANSYRYVNVNVPSYRYQAWAADEVISNVTRTSTTLVVGQYTVFVFNAFAGVDYAYTNRECITSLANASGNSIDGGQITHTYEKGVTTYAYNVTITNPTYLNFNYYCQENQAKEAMYGFVIYKNA